MTESGGTAQQPPWISVENRQDTRFKHTYRVKVPGSGTYFARGDDGQRAAAYVVEELGYATENEIAEKCRVEMVEPKGRRPGSAAGKLIPREDFDHPLPPELLAAFEGVDSDSTPLAAPPLEVEKVIEALRWELCAPSDAVDLVPEDLPEIVTVETVEGGLRLRFAGHQYFRLAITREEGGEE